MPRTGFGSICCVHIGLDYTNLFETQRMVLALNVFLSDCFRAANGLVICGKVHPAAHYYCKCCMYKRCMCTIPGKSSVCCICWTKLWDQSSLENSSILYCQFQMSASPSALYCSMRRQTESTPVTLYRIFSAPEGLII